MGRCAAAASRAIADSRCFAYHPAAGTIALLYLALFWIAILMLQICDLYCDNAHLGCIFATAFCEVT